MLKKLLALFLFGLIVFLGFRAVIFYKKNLTGIGPAIKPAEKIVPENTTDFPLSILPGYKISIFAKNLTNARDLEFDPRQTVIVSLTSEGKIVALPDKDNDGIADKQIVVLEKLNLPHGIAFWQDKLYVAETNQVFSYDWDPVNFTTSNKQKIIDLPKSGGHFTRSLLFTPEARLLISVGSSCNACIEKDDQRAKILSVNPDGAGLKVYAKGLRNAVFMTLNQKTTEVWVTEMGRDLLGDDIPPDEINIAKEGRDYGWPYCFGDKKPDPELNKENSKIDCSLTESPEIEIPAHSAPLGLAFYQGDLLVSYHGSWNRSVPTGYKVVRFKNGKQSDFITGWLDGDKVLGRPVDILVKDENTIYISDDKAGVIYTVVVIK